MKRNEETKKKTIGSNKPSTIWSERTPIIWDLTKEDKEFLRSCNICPE